MPTGWSSGTLRIAVLVVRRAHLEHGGPDPTRSREVEATLDRLTRDRPSGSEARRPLRFAEVSRLSQVEAPIPGQGILAARLSLLLAG